MSHLFLNLHFTVVIALFYYLNFDFHRPSLSKHHLISKFIGLTELFYIPHHLIYVAAILHVLEVLGSKFQIDKFLFRMKLF